MGAEQHGLGCVAPFRGLVGLPEVLEEPDGVQFLCYPCDDGDCDPRVVSHEPYYVPEEYQDSES